MRHATRTLLGALSPQERLPEVEFEEAEPQTYRFVCEYQQSDADEVLVGKQRIEATYVRGLPAGRVEWSDASIARAEELEADFPAPGAALDYMSGFGYDSPTPAAAPVRAPTCARY